MFHRILLQRSGEERKKCELMFISFLRSSVKTIPYDLVASFMAE